MRFKKWFTGVAAAAMLAVAGPALAQKNPVY